MESKLLLGDCKDKLKELDDNSVDLMATDPPYGLSFMGKEWDSFNEVENIERDMPNTVYAKKGFKKLPRNKPVAMKEFFVPIWKECLRVLKPGGFAFVMAAPKQDVLRKQIETLDEAGFRTDFTSIYWTYATGFPKAMNIGKAVNKKLGDEAKDLDGSYAGFQPKPAVEVVIVAMKPLDKKGYLEQAMDNGKGVTWFDDCRIPFASMSDIPQGGYGDMKVGYGKPGETQPMSEDYDKYVEKQKSFKGAKTIGEVKEGGTTFLGGDMKQQNPAEVYQRKTTKRKPREEGTVFKTSGFKSEDNDTAEASPLGRFPANLLVSDDVLNDGKIRKAGKYKGEGSKSGGIWSKSTGEPAGREYGDKGDFSRYYSLDEWWKRYFKDLPEEVQKTFPFIIVPKANKREKNMGMKVKGTGSNTYNKKCLKCGKWQLKQGYTDDYTCRCKDPEWEIPSGNLHPTVKPVQLFSYLITLGSRKGDVVLDPFAGSGTTGISCVFSERKYILIEREEEYFKIMEARIEKAKNPADLVEHGWF